MDVDGKTLFSVNDVVAALGGAVEYDAATHSYEIKLRGKSAVFGTETPIAVVETRLVSLFSPARGEGSVAFADTDFFQKVVGPILSLSFAFERATRVFTARRVEVPEIAVDASVADFDATSKVVFRFSEPPQYKVEKGADQVVLRFPNVRLAPGTPEPAVDDPLVARISIRAGEAVVFLREKGLSTNVYALGAPPRLVVDVTRPTAPSATPGAPPRPPPARAEPKTIVLDAGHGGTELGAKGPEGLLEKDAMLALVRTVKEALGRRGYKVVTTRDSDASVSLEERAATANAAKADVFLSLHANASRSAAAHGTEVYYLSLDASDRAAAALAESENRPSAEATPSAETNAALRDLDLILWDLAQNQHLAASARLAEIIQADFNRLLGVTTRGVKQAPFKVLIGVNAPAVLVEVAFITNPDEEKRLAAEEFRREVADTLAGSLENYFKTADGTAPVGRGPASRAR